VWKKAYKLTDSWKIILSICPQPSRCTPDLKFNEEGDWLLALVQETMLPFRNDNPYLLL